MGINIIPVMTAMYLGSSFNLLKYEKGSADIYDYAYVQENRHVIDRSFTKSEYKLVESSIEARKFLDVAGALSLKIKREGADKVDIGGSGAYLQETANRQNFVELLIRVQHETVTETIPSYLKPRTDWMSMASSKVGTHFVRSITYGGELIGSFRLKASNREEREIIKAAVTTNLQLTGTFDINANGSFDKLRKDLKGMYNEEIKVTATTKTYGAVQSVERLMEIVEQYPDEIRSMNEGKGKALKAELYPLASLKSDYAQYLPNSAFNNLLDDIESKFDDLRITTADFSAWNKKRSLDITEEQEEEIEEFYQDLTLAQQAFNLAISDLDTSSNKDASQFKKALDAYGTGAKNIPNRFQRSFWKLKHDISGEELVWKKAKGSGVTYINWGSRTCDSFSKSATQLLYSGYAAGTSLYAWNSGKNTECLPDTKPVLSSVLRSMDSTAWIQSLQRRDFENPEEASFLRCAVCLATDKIMQEMFAGMIKCPESWSLEYSGYLMADSSSNVDREFVCVNKKKDETNPFGDEKETTPKFNSVFMHCEKCGEEKVVPCVVCTK